MLCICSRRWYFVSPCKSIHRHVWRSFIYYKTFHFRGLWCSICLIWKYFTTVCVCVCAVYRWRQCIFVLPLLFYRHFCLSVSLIAFPHRFSSFNQVNWIQLESFLWIFFVRYNVCSSDNLALEMYLYVYFYKVHNK